MNKDQLPLSVYAQNNPNYLNLPIKYQLLQVRFAFYMRSNYLHNK